MKKDNLKCTESMREYGANWIKTNKRDEYLNIPISFDIETSSFYNEQNEKTAIMYHWQMMFDKTYINGRTWNEFLAVLDFFKKNFELNEHRRIIIYVHNLSYEFQFMYKYFKWEKVFATNNRKPIYAITTDGIEFRCSYLLSGYSLGILAKQLGLKKLKGDLDYEKIRSSETPLTEKEKKYCFEDVHIVTEYIRKEIEKNGDITKIPLTKTGYVRKHTREKCLYCGKHHKRNWGFYRFIHNINITPEEYTQLKLAFQGGFTHASAYMVDNTLSDVSSIDFTSSYPAVMLTEKFPCSSAEKIYIKNKNQFIRQLNCYCCIFDIKFYNLEPKNDTDHYISSSRCWSLKNQIEDNGRIVSADELTTTITNVDYSIIEQFYVWEKIEIRNFRRYRKNFLPKEIIETVLELYKTKTELKGVPGFEDEYLNKKELLNSMYGMSVTDILRTEFPFTDKWENPRPPKEESKKIDKYNKNEKRFLSYSWGVFITAYARRNLFTGIKEFEDDYVYSDTDSIKCLNYEKHLKYIDKYNKIITKKLEVCMQYYEIPKEKYIFKNNKGIEKPIGVWEYEGKYDKFKTLGAKRYAYEKNGKINITVSGLNKKTVIPYMEKKIGNKFFDRFADGLYVPPEHTGKMTHTYIDEERNGFFKDYLGKEFEYSEKSCVHLEKAEYTMSRGINFVKYLMGIREEII